jgi:hypothetical protein
MATKPKVIAISDTANVLNTSNKILFYQHDWNENTHKFYMVEYNQDTHLDDLTSCDTIDLESTKMSMDDFPDIDSNIKTHIENFIGNTKYEIEHTVFIPWGIYTVVYLTGGSILIVTNTEIVYEYDDKDTTYQTGDGSCELYLLSNGDMLIRNHGDVTSSILFTLNYPQLYLHDLKHDEDKCCDDGEDDTCFICNNHEVELSMDIIKDLEMELVTNYIL